MTSISLCVIHTLVESPSLYFQPANDLLLMNRIWQTGRNLLSDIGFKMVLCSSLSSLAFSLFWWKPAVLVCGSQWRGHTVRHGGTFLANSCRETDPQVNSREALSPAIHRMSGLGSKSSLSQGFRWDRSAGWYLDYSCVTPWGRVTWLSCT